MRNLFLIKININRAGIYPLNIVSNRILDCCLQSDRQQMAITNTVSSNSLSAFIDCLDCFLLLPIRCDKVIEIVTSFLHKTLVNKYLHGT